MRFTIYKLPCKFIVVDGKILINLYFCSKLRLASMNHFLSGERGVYFSHNWWLFRINRFFIAFVIRLCTPIRLIVITLVLICKIQYISWWCANMSFINTSENSWLQLRWKISGVRCAAVQDCDDDENLFWICRLEIWTLISGRTIFSI